MRYGIKVVRSLWDLAGIPVAVKIHNDTIPVSQLQGCRTFGKKTSYRLMSGDNFCAITAECSIAECQHCCDCQWSSLTCKVKRQITNSYFSKIWIATSLMSYRNNYRPDTHFTKFYLLLAEIRLWYNHLKINVLIRQGIKHPRVYSEIQLLK